MNYENHDTQQQQQHSSSSTNVNTASLKDDAQDLQMAQVLMSLKQVRPRCSIEDIYETILNEHQFEFDEFLYEDDDNEENFAKSRKRFRKRNPKFADYDHYDYSDDLSYPIEMLYLKQPPEISSKTSYGKVPHWGGYGRRCPRQPMHDVTHVQHVKEIICSNNNNNEILEQIQTPTLPKIQNLRELRDRLDNMTKALSAIPPISGNTDYLVTPYKLVSVHPQNIPPVFQPTLPTLQQLTSLANNFPPFSQHSIPPTSQYYYSSTPKKQLKQKQNSFRLQQQQQQGSSFARNFYDSTTPVKRKRMDITDEGENSSMFLQEVEETIEDSWQSLLNIQQNNQFFDKSDLTQQQEQQMLQQQQQIETPKKLQQSSSSSLKFNACINETPKLAQLTLLQQKINKELLDQSNNPIGQCKLDEFVSADPQFPQQNLGNKPVKQIFSMLKRGLISVGDVVEYHGKKDCEVKARGEITVEGIKCWRCKGVVGTSYFENHCAGSTLRRPAENIYIIKQDLNQKVLLQTLIDDLNPEKMRKRQKRWREKQLMMMQVGSTR